MKNISLEGKFEW